MPTSKYFSGHPSFPIDPTFPVADIPTLSLQQLQSGSDRESLRLYDACRQHGFMLLDLKDSPEGKILLHHAEVMFGLIETTLSLDQDVLDRYACNAPRDLTGYKRKGMLRTEDGKKDAIEVYTLSQDDIMGNVPARANPEPIESHRNDCQAFFKHAYAAVAIILNHLESHLDLQPGTLAAQCSLDKPSATAVRMLLSPAQQVHEDRRINFGGHTDIGIITLLFNVAGGLQILPAGAKNEGSNWRYIRPQEGCALINIGDTLTEWTGGLLRSSLHRVVSPPGGQAQFPRRSLAYLVRAERNATVRRLKGGGVIPALSEGEEEDARNVDAWAAWRAQQIMNGELKPQSRGGN